MRWDLFARGFKYAMTEYIAVYFLDNNIFFAMWTYHDNEGD
jgi:hypothetical protein